MFGGFEHFENINSVWKYFPVCMLIIDMNIEQSLVVNV